MWKIALAFLAVTEGAREQPTPPVTGTRPVIVERATVKDDPDVAVVSYTIHGEGVTSGAALTQIGRRRIAITAGLTQFAGGAAPVTTGEVSGLEARDRSCDAQSSDD